MMIFDDDTMIFGYLLYQHRIVQHRRQCIHRTAKPLFVLDMKYNEVERHLQIVRKWHKKMDKVYIDLKSK